MKVLVVAAHPDDEILGCGGTIARFCREKNQVYTLILGEGITARDEKRDEKRRKEEIIRLRKQTQEANTILGVKQVFFFDFPDNRFDTVPLLNIVKAIEEIKGKIKPDIIFTHYARDLNIDHQIAFRAVITATRPLMKETIKEVYSFEVLSSTEWNYPLSFSADVFFDISKTINLKLKAMKRYSSEMRKFPHPRSINGIKLNAQLWGMRVGLKYVEAFKNVRLIK